MQSVNVNELSNHELDQKLVSSAKYESGILRLVLIHLAEMDNRKFYRELGYSSLFDYSVRRLKYSESSASRRIAVARLSTKFKVLELIENQEVTLCNLAQVAPILTEDNFNSVIKFIKNKSFRDVQGFVATFKEPVKVRETIKAIPAPVRVNREDNNKITPEFEFQTQELKIQEKSSMISTPTLGVTSNEEQFLIKFAADKEFMTKLEELKKLKGNKPLLKLLKLVMDEYVERHSPKKREEKRAKKATSNQLKEATPDKSSRYIPAAIKDAVYIRDEGRCSYVGINGVRCSATHGLELDHIKSFSLGGSHEETNLKLLCKAHNQLHAEQVFGREFIRQCIVS